MIEPPAAAVAAAPSPNGARQVQYGAPPAWVLPAPEPTATPTPEGAPLRVVYLDQQARLGPDADEIYTVYRIKLLDPAALATGALTLTWNPSGERLTVNAVRIVRDGKPIDVLAQTRFDIIQRENNLERSVLDGELTAALQAPGLQVGDELEVAQTLRRSDPTLGSRSFGFLQLPTGGAPGAFRVRLTWPQGRNVRWRAWPDLPALKPAASNGRRELVFDLRDPKSAIAPEGAPERYRWRRTVQYSSFASWSELSNLLWPLFDAAARLPAGSAVREEAARIAAASPDPVARTTAALRLVQERVRYVYVGLNGANYRPATADDTWTRRFGDCKAKTVLLLALLRELHVEAEPVLVSSKGGDGTDQMLPTPAAFDHIVLRTTLNGRTYWLDGTRPGDHALAAAPPPAFRWGLPLRAGSVGLEPVKPEALSAPQLVEVIDLDARAGFAAPAKIKLQQVLRGDEVFALRAQLASFSPEDASRTLKAYWRQQLTWAEPETVGWRFDDAQNALVMTMAGEGKPEWEGDDRDGHTLDIYAAGFRPPAPFKRPVEQDQSAPWLIEFPRYHCWVTTIRLPPAGAGWRWSYLAAPVDRRFGGVSYWRAASLQGGVMRTLMSSRALAPEIGADEARAVDAQLPAFDNKVSRVFQEKGDGAARAVAGPAPPVAEAVDWSSPSAPCAAPG